MSENVYIIGVGMLKFGKYLEKGIKALTGEALEEVLKDAGQPQRRSHCPGPSHRRIRPCPDL
jgi:acetyl-CoA acetyltransferase